MIRITSKSQIKKNKKFKISDFKPFCFNEKKKYKIYEMPKFKSHFFKDQKNKDLKKNCLFISGPARSGNHLLLSLLDNHPQLGLEVGEDDMLRTVFSHVNNNETEVVKNLTSLSKSYILNLSGQPKMGVGKGLNKWKKLNELNKKKISKTQVWSGNQPEGEAHITDFQDMIQNIDYDNFEKFIVKNKKYKIKNFLGFFDFYLKAKSKLTKNKKFLKYGYRWCGSGLRRELFYLFERSNKITCITPIRKFENFYYSYAKTRHGTLKIEKKALNDLWEHWRHKVIDYLILKEMYPNKIHLVKFEDLVSKPEKVSRELCKLLNIKFSKNMLKPTLLGKKHLGNSSFKKSLNNKGKIYKSSINRKLNGVKMPQEYSQIINLISKKAIKV